MDFITQITNFMTPSCAQLPATTRLLWNFCGCLSTAGRQISVSAMQLFATFCRNLPGKAKPRVRSG
jgi:hypothetical protein